MEQKIDEIKNHPDYDKFVKEYGYIQYSGASRGNLLPKRVDMFPISFIKNPYLLIEAFEKFLKYGKA